MPPEPSPFWAFSLALYAQDGVATAAIALQDRHGLDVNFLLLCAFAGSQSHALTDGELTRLEARAAPWRQNVVHPLRGARRWLKEQRLVPAEAVDELRRDVLEREIAAEEVQQHLMEAELEIACGPADAATIAGNLLHYAQWEGVTPDAEDLNHLATILAAAVPGTDFEAARKLLHPVGG